MSVAAPQTRRRSTITFRTRRRLALTVTALASLLMIAIVGIQGGRLADVRWISGWTLLACVFVLIAIGIRKRLPVLPLLSVSVWTQIHLHTGLFTFIVYLIHVPRIIAAGPLEFLLSLAFLTVSLSGLYGWYASRTIPPRLTAIEGQHRFDQSAWHRSQIADASRQLIDAVATTAAGDLLRQHYQDHLHAFFTRRASLRFLIRPGSGRRRRMLDQISQLDRYLDDDAKTASGRLMALVRHRDDVDYQFALQLRLRVWVAFHATLSIALLALSLLHAVLAIRFTTGS